MKRVRSLGVVCAVLFCGSAAFADTYPRQPGVDAFHYVFRLDISDTRPEIVGDATVDLLLVRDNVTEVALDLATESGGKGMAVSGVTLNGQPVPHVHKDNRLTIPIQSSHKAGEHLVVGVSYHGAPANGLRLITEQVRRVERVQRELAEPRARVAADDRSSVRQGDERVHRHRAVEVSGRRERTAAGDDRSRRRPPRDALEAVRADCVMAERDRRRAVLRPSRRHGEGRRAPDVGRAPGQATPGPTYFEGPARQALEFYSEHVGPYPYEKLANVAAAGISGGTEHASAIFYGERGVRPQPAFGLVAHEIAHQWFGDSITETRLGRRLAERGLRDLLHAPVRRSTISGARRWSRA